MFEITCRAWPYDAPKSTDQEFPEFGWSACDHSCLSAAHANVLRSFVTPSGCLHRRLPADIIKILSRWSLTQQVKLPGVLSRHGEVIAGVAQDGVISPTLFNVHVNDLEYCIPKGIPVSTCKYADDCTLYELVFKDPVSQMQDAVTHLERWAV